MRLFIAIELPEEIKQGITKVQQELRTSGADANWTRPEGVHLTLKFLGEVPEGRVRETLAALGEAAKGTGTLGLTVEGAGAFPNTRAPRVLWLGVKGDVERLSDLQGKVEDAMAGLGFEREERTFSPHLTLARIKFPKPRNDWPTIIQGIRDVKIGAFEAGHISLMKSELRRDGAVYTEVGRIEL